MVKLPAGVFRNMQKPYHKTLTDSIKLLVAKWRDKVKKNIAASGIAEELTEADEILDDMILKLNEAEEH